MSPNLQVQQPNRPRNRGTRWILKATGKLLILSACISIVYISLLLTDVLIQYIIVSLVIGDLLRDSNIANWVNGFKIASAAIIGMTYLLHLLYEIFDGVRFILRVERKTRKEEMEEEEEP
jgi:hypothetical protein